MKKKILFLLTTILATIGMATMVSAKTTESTVKVNPVESIMISDPMSVSDSYDWGAGVDSITDVYKVKFVLDSPAYVKVSVNSTICYEGLEPLGVLNDAIVTTIGGKQVGEYIGASNHGIHANEQFEQYYILEKGTYYVVYNGKEDNSDSEYSSGTVTTTVEAQYLTRTGNVTGISTKTMIPLTNNRPSYGYLSDLYGEQYFKVVLTKKSKVKFDMSIAETPSCFTPEVTYDLLSIAGASYQKDIQPQECISFPSEYNRKYRLGIMGPGTGYYYPSSGTTGYVTLPAGTYYLKISKYSIGEDNNVCVKVTPNIIEINEQNTTPVKKTVAKVLKVPKLKVYKKNTKKITGTAPKRSIIKVKVGKKTYTVKANAKGNFTVKLKSKLKKKQKIVIYATMNGYKNSKKVTYKVK